LFVVGNAAQAQSTTVTFTDVTVAAGMSTMGYTFGNPIWGDFDSDGHLDLFVDDHDKGAPFVYHNNGNATFTNIEPSCLINIFGDRHGAAWGDFNNDGYLDLAWSKGAKGGHALGSKKDELWMNLGNLTFHNIAKRAGTTNTWGRGRSMSWGDFDHDGFLDLLDGNTQTPLVLLKNNGNSTFTDVTAAAGLSNLIFNEATFIDYDNDGWPDIYCTIAQRDTLTSDRLYRNNHDGTFTDVSQAVGLSSLTFGRAIAWGDYDNDVYLDLFVSRGEDNAVTAQTLYHNNQDGTFTDVTTQAGIDSPRDNRAAVWGDFDNDGYLDLYVVDSGLDPAGKTANHLYHNNQNGTFTDVATEARVEDAVVSRGRCATFGDYDQDGFLDLFVTDGEDGTDFYPGPQTLFHNDANNSNHWLEIVLIGTSSNRQGLHAGVTIKTSAGIQYRQNDGGGGHFLSQGAAPIHFGLGQQTVVKQLSVKWPSGIVQRLRNVAADQSITITEGSN